MMPETPDQPGYANAAPIYWAAGWRGIIPVKYKHKGGKGAMPAGFHGRGGADTSYADITAWSEVRPGDNLCLRLPHGIIGIDVDAYGEKTGAQAFVEAIRRWGPLPETVRSTSRGAHDAMSGIRLYRVPAEFEYSESIAFPELGIGDIEIVQHHHRYVMSWPSIHPEDRLYQWLDEQLNVVGIPVQDEIPELPQAWVDALRVDNRIEADVFLGEGYDVRLALTKGEKSVKVADRMREAIKEMHRPGVGRHDVTRKHVMALLRLGKSGEPGVESALVLLGRVFIAAVGSDRDGGAAEAEHEYKSMVFGKGVVRELSNDNLTDWMSLISIPEAEPAPAPVPEMQNAPPIEISGAPDTPALQQDAQLHHSLIDPALAAIERGFWESRDSLSSIFNTSLAMMASPWAVLAYCAARALTTVPPNATLPPLIGGPGTLNWFAAVVALSSGGKGASGACSKLLVPLSEDQIKPTGSGEGILAAFGRPQDDDDPEPTNEALMFDVTEIDTLGAMNNRSASTTLPLLRSAFSGEQLGFSYSDKTKRRLIPAHAYRMTMVVGVQPLKAGWLIDDHAGGTPQRFMWFPAEDSRISLQERWPGGALTLPDRSEWKYPRELRIPDAARYTIRAERVKRSRGDRNALDGHALYCREKFAFALAVLDGRIEMSDQDWELSGIAAEVSTYTRELMMRSIEEAAKEEAVRKGQLRGWEMESAEVEKLEAQIKRGERVLRWVVRKIESSDGGRISQTALTEGVAGRDRRTLHDLLQAGHMMLQSELIDGRVMWSKA